MAFDSVIDAAQKQFQAFTLADPEVEDEHAITFHCQAAADFYAWHEDLLAQLGEKPTPSQLDNAFVALERSYWSRYMFAPRECRNYVGDRGDKHCLHAVHRDAFFALRAIEERQLPRVFYEPERKPEPRYEIAGIPMGIAQPVDEDA